MIINDELIHWAKNYKGKPYHAILTDAPYELGFMGKDWDNTGIAFNPETWKHLKDMLLPGAFGMAFASSRGWHRMAVAIEDAGFVIHPTIFGWVKSVGFPKATDVSKMIMKQENNDGEEIMEEITKEENLFEKEKKVKQKKIQTNIANKSNDKTGRYNWNTKKKKRKDSIDIKKPTHPKAKQWNGWKYGLQALKPVCEPIICFQKPYVGKPIQCIVENGCGALNIDSSRINTNENLKYNNANGCFKNSGNGKKQEKYVMKNYEQTFTNSKGRFPANFLVSDETAPLLDKQSGNCKSSGIFNRDLTAKNNWTKTNKCSDKMYNDKGGASRFFYNVQTKIDESDPFIYQAKASKAERNAGCEELEEKKQWLKGGGGTGIFNRENVINKNNHPTVKPIDLARYLATLLLPPEEYKPKLLIPFSGSGSEYIGAMKAGWDNIDGIEMDKEYCKIANARIKFWQQKIKDDNAQQTLL